MSNIPSDLNASVGFYDDRYQHGYMGYWSSFEQKRIFDLVKELKLPEQGTFLDVGCGRGIFTHVLAKALPGWKICGCDVSETALKVAAQNNPDGTFYHISSPELKSLKADFIHSHHVLEHTADLDATIRLILNAAKPHCVMLHSLPCNHEGSLEQIVSAKRKKGVDPKSGTFFFEDDAHLRRMSEEQLTAYFSSSGFRLVSENYSNQYHGAIKWLSESTFGLVWRFTQNDFKLRMKLLFTWFCFFTASVFDKQDKGRFYAIRKVIQFFFALCFFWLALPVRALYNHKAKAEWKHDRKKRNGSEMFLAYAR